MQNEPTEKPNALASLINSLRLKSKIWQFILLAILILGIIIALNFIINSYLSYKQAAEVSELNRQLETRQNEMLELQRLTGESINALKNSEIEREKERKLRLEAEEILNASAIKSDKKLVEYDKARRAVIKSTTNYSTDDLIERAKKFGIKVE